MGFLETQMLLFSFLSFFEPSSDVGVLFGRTSYLLLMVHHFRGTEMYVEENQGGTEGEEDEKRKASDSFFGLFPVLDLACSVLVWRGMRGLFRLQSWFLTTEFLWRGRIYPF